jgi:guanylate kinase
MGKLIILSGSSGSGKTTICRKLLEMYPQFRFSVSATTREPRENEENGKDYHFYSRDEFEALIEQGKLAEWEEVHGNLYGTLKETIERAIHEPGGMLMDVDPKGALRLKAMYPGAVTIFIKAESIDTLLARLRERKTESKDQIAKRLERYNEELPLAEKFDFIVLNKTIEQSVRDVASVIDRADDFGTRL